ncbi:hypothetical protein SLE2022_089810 [Rubroshorea leprosula]
MASNPPYQVEDQTDEDFFDKLVDEDDDSLGYTASRFEEGNDSDDARAFANLTLGEDLGGEAENEKEGGKNKVDAVSEPINACVSQGNNDSLGFDDSVTDSSNCNREDGGSEVGPDLIVNKSTGSVNSGVKEVGWGSFYAESGQKEEQGFDFFNELGDSSSRDFPGIVEGTAKTNGLDHNLVNNGVVDQTFVGGGQYQEGVGASVGSVEIVQDVNNSQYWENMYPGWKYDANSGQWYQVDSYEGGVQGSFESSGGDCIGTSNGKSEVSYLQHSTQSLSGTVTTVENGTTESVANWNQVSQLNNGYPEHMVFDPQYPGWYYDMIAQQWYTLESYNSSFQSSTQSTIQAHDQQDQNGYASIGRYTHDSNSNGIYGDYGQADNYGSQGIGGERQYSSWDDNHIHHNNNNSNNQGLNMLQTGASVKTESFASSVGYQQLEGSFHSKMSLSNHIDQQKSSFDSLQEVQLSAKANQSFSGANGVIGFQSFVPSQEFNQKLHQGNVKQNEQMHFSNNFYVSQNPVNVAQQPFHGSQQFAYVSDLGRSSAGRPPHALVSFGFGGKLIVMKDASSIQTSSFGSQGSPGGSISVLNLLEVVNGNTNGSGSGPGTCDYFRALCQQSFPGPLVGGSVGSKELNKWIDDRITNCESPDMAPRKGEVLRLLLSLLKIACQHYGKLRSPFGSDIALKESDTPESAVAKLFASAKKNRAPYGALGCCFQPLPSEGQIRATASELQNLLVSGKKYEALQCAQEGQLWGPALVLASQLGDQFYVDTVKQMALRQLLPGSPLRTLCLLIAGQPAEVFSQNSTANSINMSQQPAQFGANCMLDDWEENLAVIAANRTKDDGLVLIHLGDCLWRERSEITAAHICYLVAEANFESYSDSARLCLIGADHWKFPRTFASPEAIQRTELYEYSKVLGNSQFILLPFQPYKLIYAHMLAEVGRISDSLKYCQAALKSLKTGRTPEVEIWKQLLVSLEERIRNHQQGGYAANLAPAKLVDKLLNFVVGGHPPSAPSTSAGNSQGNELHHQLAGPRVSSSQSTMAMSSLMPSASMEPIRQWAADGNKMTIHNRSVSEPDFGRSPRQVDSSMEVASSSTEGKASGGASRFARFGFGSQILRNTVGLVLRPRAERQAKLGEENKFYYDEKLKRWVEEGAEAPAEEAALAPPPTTVAFQNGMHEYNLNSALKNEGSPTNGSPKFRNTNPTEHASGIPPIPTSSNQFATRGRMGVRARYVDTFNKGGGNQANQFQSPALSSVRPAAAAMNAKFFIPAPTSTAEQTTEVIAESAHDVNASNGNPSTSIENDSFQSPSPSTSMTMQRFPSMDTIDRKGSVKNNNANGLQSHPRRRGSWGGSFGGTQGHPNMAEMKPQGEAFGMPPSFMPSPVNGSSNFGDDLHEVEL